VNSASGGAEQVAVNIVGIDSRQRSECHAIGDSRMNVDNPNTTRTLEYTKDEYNVKKIK
jgi:hypothetical protein